MNTTIGPLVVERAYDAAAGRMSYRIAWTEAQPRQIGQAIEAGDQSFLAKLEVAMHQALHGALKPKRG